MKSPTDKFLSVKGRKCRKWLVEDFENQRAVRWSTDGNDLFAIGVAHGGAKNPLFAVDFDISPNTNHLITPMGLPSDNYDWVYEDPTDLIRYPSNTHFEFRNPETLMSDLKAFFRWTEKVHFVECTLLDAYEVYLTNPLTGDDSFSLGRYKGTFLATSKKASCVIPVKPLKKIVQTMKVSKILSIGKSYRDPFYFYGTVEGNEALAIVSPYK